MLKNLKKIFLLLSPREKKQAFWMLPAMTTMGMFQVLGVASILPFLSLVSDPLTLKSTNYLNWLYTFFHFTSANHFTIAVGIAVLCLLTFSNAFTAFTMRWLYLFTFMQNHSLSMKMLGKYLHQPYVYFLNHNSAGLSTNILAEVQQVVAGVIVPWMQMIANIITSVFILAVLIISQPVMALLTSIFLGGTYLVVYGLLRRKLASIGKERVRTNKKRYQIAGEALGGIKEVKLMGKEEFFIDQFAIPSVRFAKTQADSTVMGTIPHYAIETIAFGGLILVVLYFLGTGKNITQLIPIIGLYAFAAYRLLPALQSIFTTVTKLRFNQPALDALYADLIEGRNYDQEKTLTEDANAIIHFQNRLELSDLTFYYPETQTPIFDHINLTIFPNTSVAFVGATGAGKTTLVDVILGLLHPQNGQVRVDGVPLTEENISRWQKNLGYVPQNIFLTDDTLAHNIAFGVSKDQINMDAVIRAARIASLHDFIMELPKKYDTLVGERGVRISGGQRQRVGIARALYHDPDVIIFDEATNALDSITEEIVFSAIAEISKLKTSIVIAHRLSTIRNCDSIYLLDGGCILAQGNYQTLFDTNAQFRAMANEGSAKGS